MINCHTTNMKPTTILTCFALPAATHTRKICRCLLQARTRSHISFVLGGWLSAQQLFLPTDGRTIDRRTVQKQKTNLFKKTTIADHSRYQENIAQATKPSPSGHEKDQNHPTELKLNTVFREKLKKSNI